MQEIIRARITKDINSISKPRKVQYFRGFSLFPGYPFRHPGKV
nr:MAG TPA: hypothetical protein [Caudoviricetes sp.]